MITKEQALAIPQGASIIHCCMMRECSKTVGPRGGVTTDITVARASRRCQTWKTRPEQFRLPIRHGLRVNGYITERNAERFHLAEDCPVKD